MKPISDVEEIRKKIQLAIENWQQSNARTQKKKSN